MPNLLIEIRSGDVRLANCSYKREGCTNMTILYLIRDIIDNYNKSLAGSLLPKELLAFRMLQLENEIGTLKKDHPFIYKTSLEYMQDKYAVTRVGNQKTTEGIMAVLPMDMNSNGVEFNIASIIDIKNKKVGISQYCKRMSLDDYQATKTLRVSKWDFEVVPMDINEFSFNELGDVIDFIWKNQNGFTNESRDIIYVCP